VAITKVSLAQRGWFATTKEPESPFNKMRAICAYPRTEDSIFAVEVSAHDLQSCFNTVGRLPMRTLVTSFMRLTSERVKQKLLETICQMSLAEIMVVKLLRLQELIPGTIDVALALCPEDVSLVDIAERHQCPVVSRTTTSRDGEIHEDIYGGLRNSLTELGYRRLVVINPCLPFLRTNTIADFVLEDTINTESLRFSRAAVLRHRGWVWNQDFRLIHGGQTPNTKHNAEFFTLAHAMFSYPIDVLGMPGQMDFRHFAAYDPSAEFIDIDTESDLEFARRYAAGLLESTGAIRWAD
jgi:hypothetical protein